MVTLFQCLESEFDDTSENTLADYIQPSVVASRNGIDLSIVMNFIRDRHIEMIDKRMPPEAVSRFEVALHVVCQKYCERSEALKMVDSANHLDDMVDMGHIRHQVFYGLDFYRRADLEQQSQETGVADTVVPSEIILESPIPAISAADTAETFVEDVSVPEAPVEMPAPEVKEPKVPASGKPKKLKSRPAANVKAKAAKPARRPKAKIKTQLPQIQVVDRPPNLVYRPVEAVNNKPIWLDGAEWITLVAAAAILHEKMANIWVWLQHGQLLLDRVPIQMLIIEGHLSRATRVRKTDIERVAGQDFFLLGHIGYIEFGQKIAVDPSKPVSRQSIRNWVLLGKLVGITGPGGKNYVRGDQLEQGKLLAQAAQKFVFR